jgi:RNA polymerase sigma-B factor
MRPLPAPAPAGDRPDTDRRTPLLHRPPERAGDTRSGYEHLTPLFVEHARLPEGDPRRPELRNELVVACMPIARNIGRKHRYRGENPDDLEQVAVLGLIKAIDRFDPDRGVDFVSFAVPTISGEVRHHLRDLRSTIRVPRRIRHLQGEVGRATEELRRATGHAPRPSEIARHLDLDVADVLEALEADHRAHCSSLDEPFPEDGDSGGASRYAAALSTADPFLDLVEDHESLQPLLDALPDRERRILLLRFFGNLTQSEIATSTGISQMHVSRLLSRTLAELRTELTTDRADRAERGRPGERGRATRPAGRS